MRRSVIGRMAAVIGVFGAGAIFLSSCATTKAVEPVPVEVAPVPVPAASTAPKRPELSLPAAPQRSEADVWREAYRRADGLRPVVQADLAAVVPGPLPEVAKPVPAPAPAAPQAQPPAPAAPGMRAVEKPEAPTAKSPVVPSAPPEASRPAQPPATPVPVSSPIAAEAKPRTTVPKQQGRPAVPALQVVQKFTVENGLPSGRVTAIFVDNEDAWVGTADAGVARYNFQEGNWFVTKVEDGLASNRISDVTKYKGKAYVATQDGISIWDGVSWTTVDVAKDTKVKLVNALFRLHDGVLWVAARSMFGGLVTFDGETWRDRSAIKQGVVLNNVSDFAFAGKSLWIGTTNRGLLRFDGKDWTSHTVSEGLASNFVYTLGVKGDNCYVGGCCGLSALEEDHWRIYDVAEGMPHSTVNTIVVDGDIVWLGSKKGLSLFDGFNFTNFFVDSGLTDDRITSLFVKGNDVWVGTGNGLNRMVKSY